MKILLAEDEKDLSSAEAEVLKQVGYEVDIAGNGAEAVAKSAERVYDVMIFDIMMPEMDGIEALKIIRKRGDNTPVILLTAKTEIDDRVVGLESGADDYLSKPFAMKELLARIRALLRRQENYSQKLLTVWNVQLDTVEQELSSRNSIHLAGMEARMMELFMRNPGKSFTTEELLHRVWKEEPEEDSRIVWVYISYLRQKLRSIETEICIRGEEGGSFMLTNEADTGGELP